LLGVKLRHKGYNKELLPRGGRGSKIFKENSYVIYGWALTRLDSGESALPCWRARSEYSDPVEKRGAVSPDLLGKVYLL
jgi:hypothetical protein